MEGKMAGKKSHKEFIEELSEKVPSIKLNPDIEQVYINTVTQMGFICTDNHSFNMTPKNLLTRVKGCPVCNKRKRSQSNTIAEEDFIARLATRNCEHHPVFNVEPYNGMTKFIQWTCEKGHTWKAAPKTVTKGHGCPKCSEQDREQRYSRTFLNINLQDRGIRVLKCLEESKAQVQCTTCKHVWIPKICDILAGKSNCSKCSKSSYSKKSISWLNKLMKENHIDIQHAENRGEYRLPGTRIRVDGFCEHTNTVYEFYGDMWHGNPEVFDQEEVNPVSLLTYRQLYEQTKQREERIIELGYNLITIWENDFIYENDYEPMQYNVDNHVDMYCPPYFENFMNNLDFSKIHNNIFLKTPHLICFWKLNDPDLSVKAMEQVNKAYNVSAIHILEDEWNSNCELVKAKIQHLIKSNQSPRIHARKCDIVHISNKDKTLFLNQFHIQGNCSSSVNIGAKYRGEMIAVMTFTRPRAPLGVKNINDAWELSRFATNVNFRIPGIASKLLSHFRKKYPHDEIFSYADRRWSNGELYQRLGFERERISKPNYWYVVNGKRYHRWNFTKRGLERLGFSIKGKTESQITKEAGISKLWDCGTIRYSTKNNK